MTAAFTGWNDWGGDEDGEGEGDGEGDGGGEDEDGGDGEGEGDEVLHLLGSRAMYATWLPGRGNADADADADCRRTTIMRDDLGIPTRDFAMDPSQDLMVLLKGGEHLGMYVLPLSTFFFFSSRGD